MALKDTLFWWRKPPAVPFAVLFKKFKSILERNNQILEIMGDMGDKLGGGYIFDQQYLIESCEKLGDHVFKFVSDLDVLCQTKNVPLFTAFERVQHQIQEELAGRRVLSRSDHILPISELTHALADEGGNKMASIGDMRNILDYPTPDGFVVTTGAYFDVMERAGLRDRVVETVTRLCETEGEGEDDGVEEVARELQEAVLSMPLPKQLEKAIVQAARKLSEDGHQLLAVRSSAWGEDGELSFAGMHDSVLGVTPKDVIPAYRQVLASLFRERALRYRIHHGQCHEEPAMAVGIILMVDAHVSGGLYTYVQSKESDPHIVVSSAWGLGKPIVDGSIETDTFMLKRDPPFELVSQGICVKDAQMVLDPSGGTRIEDVPEALREVPSLTPAQITTLCETAMNLERFFKRPLDVEWAFAKDGGLTLLQARPLPLEPRLNVADEDASLESQEAPIIDAPVIFSGSGIPAMEGVASGPVRLLEEGGDLSDFPYGAILVTHNSSPRFAKIMPKCKGIITDVGSATGHMATVARELRVPTLVSAGNATKLLKDGQIITLDTAQLTVYDGAVEALCHYELAREDLFVFEETQEYRTLKRVLKHITPLTLLDPKDDSFSPENVKTLHDIVRYVHQKAVEKLIDLSESHQEVKESVPRKLITRVPLGLTVIDLEGGLHAEAGEEVPEEDVLCLPLTALLSGLCDTGMWETRAVHVDMGSFMSSVTRTLPPSQSDPKRMGRNLAVVSEEYLNLHLRLGYHFTVVDAYIGRSINDNTIMFRFMGGVTDFSRRSRRATLIAAILEQFDFVTEIKGDMVTGRIKKHPIPAMLDKMFMIGGLIGYTRQLDALLDSEEASQHHLEDFLHRIATAKETYHDHKYS
ncbi:MAG: PEP-utilizing enzyme [Desulfobulbus sp.]|nr:PEP-utilizing enzyme [Desulfobulbus sp.]